ncbi:hypothetical protein GYMLUDRAFT_243235 [Collybiopsis luxurians FD-317 M1]|uniref:Uncharacterized protein n=1 Tax=Collybiopsis luxurians FD-317 M1 TaxID=944289 RepID=A0A0D0CR07_9AGAR|nr:hypothetical protein GYMLUDRAFT_243235 [Collybiopsis luxurians FD-317 M1]
MGKKPKFSTLEDLNLDNIILTSYLQSDVMLLSSLLNGEIINALLQPYNKADNKLNLLFFISTILTISNDASPVVHTVHAISGQINQNAIKCLNFKFSSTPVKQMCQGKAASQSPTSPSSINPSLQLSECPIKEEDDQEEDENEEENDLVADATVNIRTDSTATCMLQSMYTITAWLVSTDALATQVQTLIGKKLKVNIIKVPPPSPAKYNDIFKANLSKLFPNLKLLSSDKKNFGKMIKHCNKVKIHCEASVMVWSPENLDVIGLTIAIAVSKKCCFLYWLLHQIFNHRKDIHFSLPGTHNQVFTWIPLPQITDDILLELHTALLLILQNVNSNHSRKSSGASTTMQTFNKPQDQVAEDVMAFREQLKKIRKAE